MIVHGEYSSSGALSRNASQSSITISTVWTLVASKRRVAYPGTDDIGSIPSFSPFMNKSVTITAAAMTAMHMRSIRLCFSMA